MLGLRARHPGGQFGGAAWRLVAGAGWAWGPAVRAGSGLALLAGSLVGAGW